MSFRVPRLKRKAKFCRRRNMASSATNTSASDASSVSLPSRAKQQQTTVIPAATRITGPDEDPTDVTIMVAPVPPLFTTRPLLADPLDTTTTRAQKTTIDGLLPWLSLREWDPEDLTEQGLPRLQKDKHLKFLRNTIEPVYAARWVPMDASRPWLPYWALTGTHLLGGDTSEWRDRLIATARQAQHPEGGFGGGQGQLAHSATSYALVLALVTAGGKEVLDVVDRRAMWHWLGRMKQSDGGFTVCAGGEKDIRGAYCSMTLISLLNLPLELPPDSPARQHGCDTFLSRLPEWVSSCQTYEGGIASSPGSEAHGAYAFCGLACLSILGPPAKLIPNYFDVPALIRWLSARQRSPDSGFAGRTNKLVDGCYSHWAGGCWSLISAAAGLHTTDLWSREGLARYITSCCQAPKGGMRDKPSMGPDGYHSAYCLAGLSAAVYRAEYDEGEEAQTALQEWQDERAGIVPLTAAYRWKVVERVAEEWADGIDVKPIHPVFVVPLERAAECREYFETKPGF